MPQKKLIVRSQWLIVVTIFFCLAYSLFTIHNSLAATPIEQSRTDYGFEYSKYRDIQEKFSTAKNTYITFKTATSKEQAFAVSKAYLDQITTLYHTYFSLVKEHANTLDWQDNSAKYEQIIKTLDDLSTYFAAQKQQITDTKTLENLSAQAQQLKQKIAGEVNPQLNYITAAYEMQNTRLIYREFENLYQELSTKKQSFVNSAVLFNWQTDVDDIKNKSQAALKVAQDNFDLLNPAQTTEADVAKVESQSAAVKSQLRRSKTLFFEAARLF